MVEWGVKEALITHNTEVLVYDGKEYYTCPLKTSGAGRPVPAGATQPSPLTSPSGSGQTSPRPWPTPPSWCR